MQRDILSFPVTPVPDPEGWKSSSGETSFIQILGVPPRESYYPSPTGNRSVEAQLLNESDGVETPETNGLVLSANGVFPLEKEIPIGKHHF